MLLFQVKQKISQPATKAQPKENETDFLSRKQVLYGFAIFDAERRTYGPEEQRKFDWNQGKADYSSFIDSVVKVLRETEVDKPSSANQMRATLAIISTVFWSFFSPIETRGLRQMFDMNREVAFSIDMPQKPGYIRLGDLKMGISLTADQIISLRTSGHLEIKSDTLSIEMNAKGKRVEGKLKGPFADCDTSAIAQAEALSQIGIKSNLLFFENHIILEVTHDATGKALSKPVLFETTTDYDENSPDLGFAFYDSRMAAEAECGRILDAIPFSSKDLPQVYEVLNLRDSDNKRGIAIATDYLSRNPGSLLMRELLANACLSIGIDTDDEDYLKLAIADFNTILRSDSGYKPVLLLRAAALLMTGDLEAALKDANAGLLHPDEKLYRTETARLFSLRGFIKKEQGKLAEAARDIGEAAKIHLMENDLNEALDIVNLGLDFLPSSPILYNIRSRIHEKMGNKEMAKADKLAEADFLVKALQEANKKAKQGAP